MERLITPTGYVPQRVEEQFIQRGWKASYIGIDEAGLVETDPGAAMECIDGRMARVKRMMNGPKMPGGINAVPALKTGGDEIGFNNAARLIEELGFSPGTHKHCGFFEKWVEGAMESVQFPYELSESISHIYGKLGRWIELYMRRWNGWHFRDVNDPHGERKLVLNPYCYFTPKAVYDRFSCDLWPFLKLGIPQIKAVEFIAETVELLSPDNKVVEIVR